MIETDPPISRRLQRIRDRLGLRVPRHAVGKRGLVDHALVFLERRNMRIAEHRETVGPHVEACRDGVATGGDGLVRQPVDQVEVDAAYPGRAQPVHRGSRLRHRLHPVDGALHDRIERLHAEACPRDAAAAERRNHRRRERPRVDLDRDLRLGRRWRSAQRAGRRAGQFVRLHDGRRAAAEMDMAHRQPASSRSATSSISRCSTAR